MSGAVPGERRDGRQKGTPNRATVASDLQKAREIEIREAYERDLGRPPNIIGQTLFTRAAVLMARFEAAARDPSTKARDLIALDTAAQDACRYADNVIIGAKQRAKAEAAKARKAEDAP
jgi:hypothetical protein